MILIFSYNSRFDAKTVSKEENNHVHLPFPKVREQNPENFGSYFVCQRKCYFLHFAYNTLLTLPIANSSLVAT
jgi:hypothetical protein